MLRRCIRQSSSSIALVASPMISSHHHSSSLTMKQMDPTVSHCYFSSHHQISALRSCSTSTTTSNNTTSTNNSNSNQSNNNNNNNEKDSSTPPTSSRQPPPKNRRRLFAIIFFIICATGSVWYILRFFTLIDLYLAIISDNLVEVCRLLDIGDVDYLTTNRLTDNGDTAIFIAATEGHTTICKALLNKGGIVQLQDKVGADLDTALHRAARNGHVECCKLFLKEIGDRQEDKILLLEAVNKKGLTPYDVGVKARQAKVKDLFLEVRPGLKMKKVEVDDESSCDSPF